MMTKNQRNVYYWIVVICLNSFFSFAVPLAAQDISQIVQARFFQLKSMADGGDPESLWAYANEIRSIRCKGNEFSETIRKGENLCTMKIDSGDKSMFFWRGQFRYQLRKFTEAESDFKEAAKQGNVKALVFLANLSGERQDFLTAESLYSSARIALCLKAEAGDIDALIFIAGSGGWTYDTNNMNWGKFHNKQFWYDKGVNLKIPIFMYLEGSRLIHCDDKEAWLRGIKMLENFAKNGHIKPIIKLVEAYVQNENNVGWRHQAIKMREFKKKREFWRQLLQELTQCTADDIDQMFEGGD